MKFILAPAYAQLLGQREHPTAGRDLLQAPKKADARGAVLLDRSCFRIAPGLSHAAQTVSRPALAGASFEPSVREISAAIKDYALPIFELFEDKQKAVEFMMQRGAKFNKNLSAFDLRPIYFIFCFGGRDAAEAFFNVCLSDCTYKGRFYKLYEELANGAEADFTRSSFIGDTETKFAFVKGLKF